MSKNNNNQFGLIIVGNSGVGKSFLANILLGREAFKHEFAARSVTHRTEYEVITIDDRDFAIFNIPGLIEADQVIKNDETSHCMYLFLFFFQNRVDMNKSEIDRAFALRPNSLIIYVFGEQQGRIRNEDVVAFNAINAAYSFDTKSLLIVINGLPMNRPPNYEGEVILLLVDILEREIPEKRICFLNCINRENIEERVILRNQLLSCILDLSPKEHIKAHDIHLQVDEVAMLKAQIQEMTETFKKNQIFFEDKIREHQQRYDDLIIQQKVEAEQFQRIIDEQNEETKRMKEEQEAQVRQMEEEIRRMQEDYKRMKQEMKNKSNPEAALILQALQDSQRAQEQLRLEIARLQNTPPQVIYRSEGKHGKCVIL